MALLLYLNSHTTSLHKPDSPLSQRRCKQQQALSVSSSSRAGERISNPATCDLHRQHRGIRVWSVASPGKKKRKEKMCRCNSRANPSPQICFFKRFQAANPDQTVILIGEKHPGFTFKYLWSQLLSMTDRQRHVRRASFGVMFPVFLLFILEGCVGKKNNRSLNSFCTFF